MVMCMTVACFFGCCLWDYYDVYGVSLEFGAGRY